MRLASAIPDVWEKALPLRAVGLGAPALHVRPKCPMKAASHRHPLPLVDGSPALRVLWGDTTPHGPSAALGGAASLWPGAHGAGAVFAPRLLVAFGEQRERFTSAEALQKYAGIAPVPERRGTKSWVHWRLQCPTFLRHTCVEWAAASTRHAFWAQGYYQQQREQGKAHQAAVRALAFTWIRILSRCWQERAPYDASVSLHALKRRSAPLLYTLASGS